MRNIKVFLFFIFITATIFNIGCSSATSEGYKKRMQTWVGHDVNELLSSWGIPSDEYTMPNGSKLYTYLWVGGSIVRVGYNDILNQAYANKTTYWCKTTFTVKKNGNIETVSWEGNNCIADDPDDK